MDAKKNALSRTYNVCESAPRQRRLSPNFPPRFDQLRRDTAYQTQTPGTIRSKPRLQNQASGNRRPGKTIYTASIFLK